MTSVLYSDQPLLATLLPKMVLVVFLVVMATVATERLGRVINVVIATLPVTSGPVFTFLAPVQSTSPSVLRPCDEPKAV
jgi:hypothetical protein